jgi:hypothetical protein
MLVVGVSSRSGVGVRSQVPREGLRSYEGLTLITFALLSLLWSQGEGHKGKEKRDTIPDNWYVPSYVFVRQAALKLGLDVLSGKPPRGRARLFTLRHLAFSPSSLVLP